MNQSDLNAEPLHVILDAIPLGGDPWLNMREKILDDELLLLPSSIAQSVEVSLIHNLSKTAPWLIPYIGRG